MTDGLAGLSDGDLGMTLAVLGRDLAFPDVPDLSPMVIRRLEHEPVGRVARLLAFRRPGRRVALALAAVLILTGSAVAGSLLVRGVRILIAPEGTVRPPSPSISMPLGRQLFLGEQVTLAEARRQVDFDVLVPGAAGLGEPAPYVEDDPPGGRVSLVYPAGPRLPQAQEPGIGMMVMEFRGTVERPFLEKLVEADQVQVVQVGGIRGYWIEGDHTLTYLDEEGQAFEERSRLAGNTLLWQRGDVTLRLESALSMEEAIRIAESMR